jgi:Cu2+-exporting ATPase/Cu+-exporting ATPase
MDTLIGIGSLTAFLFSSFVLFFPNLTQKLNLPQTTYFDVVIVVIGFILLGKYLEARSKLKTGEAIEKLFKLQAKTAIIEKNGQEQEINIADVKVGDIMIVKPGTKIAVDGVITAGSSSIDESFITGEPLPVDKTIGDQVIGGTINKQGSLKFKATKIGSDTLLSQIINLVEEAQGSKAPIERLADQVSSIFVPVVLAFAIIIFIAWVLIGPQFMSANNAFALGLTSFVGILVIACPCALGLATPTSIIVAVGRGASQGILIKDAESLEKLHAINTIVMDKTGTITKGHPELTDIISTNSLNEETVLTLLASLEKHSEHPLATAIITKAKEKNINLKTVSDFKIIEGKGLEGKIAGKKYYAGNTTLLDDLGVLYQKNDLRQFTQIGKTPILLTDGKKLLGKVFIADTIKDTAKNSIASLQRLGLKVVMLTGDDHNTAQFIGQEVGVDEIIAKVLPQEKAQKIIALQKTGGKVAMVGDGINDAPALAQSDVGIAMGTGTDIAIESANITLLHGDLTKVVQAIKLSKATMRTIKQNLFWAFIYNLIGIPIAAGILYPLFGIMLSPVFAGTAMAFSSVSVVANSLRLKQIKL